MERFISRGEIASLGDRLIAAEDLGQQVFSRQIRVIPSPSCQRPRSTQIYQLQHYSPRISNYYAMHFPGAATANMTLQPDRPLALVVTSAAPGGVTREHKADNESFPGR